MYVRYALNQPAPTEFYRQLLAILKSLTGIMWGFMARGSQVIYVTSAEFPVKIRSMPKKLSPNTTVHINIENNNTRVDQWQQIVKNELKVKLLEVIEQYDVDKKYKDMIKKYNDPLYDELIDEANEQNRRHNVKDLLQFDRFSESCAASGFG